MGRQAPHRDEEKRGIVKNMDATFESLVKERDEAREEKKKVEEEKKREAQTLLAEAAKRRRRRRES